MATWLCDPSNNIEIKFDSVQVRNTTSGRKITKYSSQASNESKITYDEPLPFSISLKCMTHSSDLEDTERKFDYLKNSGIDTLLVLGSRNMALVGNIEKGSMQEDAEKSLLLPIDFTFVAKGKAKGHMIEAESGTTTGGPVGAIFPWTFPQTFAGNIGGTITGDADASEGLCMVLDASANVVYFQKTQSLWELPLGNYKLFIRAKDSNQVTSDVSFNVYNSTDASYNGTSTATLTAAYAWYSFEFTLDSLDTDDTIQFQAVKNTSGSNDVSIDMFAIVLI